MKLEDKLIRICNPIDPASANLKLSIAQSKILATVAQKIAANMFKKKNCSGVLSKLLKELTIDEHHTENEEEVNRVNEVLITFSEVISQAPEAEVSIINE